MSIFAAIIGIEKYQDAFLRPVLFAEADARAVSSALADLGCPLGNQLILINDAATKTSIEADVKTLLLSRVTAADQCFLFFSGHGFSDGSNNYLAAHDTRSRDIEGTSVRLQKLVGFVKASPCKKFVFFLDACHTGITTEDTLRAPLLGIDVGREEEFCAGFASCRAEEKSYSSKRLGQGIWTHHLLAALRGEVKHALDGTTLTAVKLQKHLADEVPRTIRAEFTTPPMQTPRFFGSFELVGPIADLAPLLAKRQAEKSAAAIKLDRVALVGNSRVRVSSLSGFKKKAHFVPPNASGAADRFVRSAATEELNKLIDAKHELLRRKMKVKIGDIEAEVRDGAATIRTPTFDYNVSICQDPDDPAMALWRHELVNVRAPAVLQDASFNEVFRNTFDIVEFTFSGKSPDIRQLAVNLENVGIEVDCPRDHSYCSFEPGDGDASVRITPGSIEFVFPRKEPPATLLAGFQSTYALLSGQPALAPLLTA